MLVMLLYTATAMRAQEPYFCTRQGVRLYYVRTNVDDGSVHWRHVMTIGKVSGGNVSYTSSFTKASGSAMYGGPISLSAGIRADGGVEMDIAGSVAAVFSNVIGAKNAHSTGGITVLPADMKPGDTLPDARAEVSAGIAKMTVTVSERKVLRSEQLTTPAGTFDCIVVQEHKVEKGTMRNRITTAQTWYARGIGMVRHDTYDKNMVLDTSEILNKIE